MRASRIASLTVAIFALGSLPYAAEPTGTSQPFDQTIAPIFIQRCLDCHSGPKPKGRLDLTTHRSTLAGGKQGKAVVPGQPGASLLWEYVEQGKMPPKKPLPVAEKKRLKAWIESGAAWGSDPIDPFRVTTDRRAGYDWWSLRPVKRPAAATVKNSGWCRNPIDSFVLHNLESHELLPSAEADRRTLIRRLYFDLTGLPPSPEEVEAFRADPAPDAYEKIVDRLLASPQYGIRWARHWLDVVRFGESNGFEHDEFRPGAWPYRDWVVDTFNRDMPYDEFVRLQLAGDVLRPDDSEAIKATGFLVAGAYDSVGQTQQSVAMRKVVREDELEDITGTVGQTFLGLTVNCARCHDHKFDPVRQVEYYRLTAALAGVRHGERALGHLDPAARMARARLTALSAEVAALEEPVRARIVAERTKTPTTLPRPIARWDFTRDYQDRIGHLHAKPRGKVERNQDGARVDGKTGFVVTAPLDRDLSAKTLEVWVRLDNLTQRGGGTISVQTLDGGTFDAIVFGEQEPGRWMAGSDSFHRTQSFQGPAENEADRKVVHVAITYGADGFIHAYRNGKPFGKPYKTATVAHFKAERAEVVFGLRHLPADGNHLLAGVIRQARLYDRALNPAEVAASAGAPSDFVEPAEIVARLTAEERRRWDRLQVDIKYQESRLAAASTRIYAVTPRPPEPTHLLIRGNPQQPGEVVAAGGVVALAEVRAEFGLRPDAPESDRRKKLADWITDRKNPLTARVIVNRLWHHHFGAGFVDTPNDFGFNGGRPSHPELLDWLAAELIEQRWSLKRLHRGIVTSATYRQSSRIADSKTHRPHSMDAGNRWLWRKSPQRLEAETVRDAMLRVAGRLNDKMGGPGFQEFRITRAIGTVTNRFTPIDTIGDDFDRRTLYRTWARGGRNPLLDVFDCPDPSTTAPRRAVTTTPLQALAMMNNILVLRLADRFAERVEREAGKDVDRQIARAYLIAYGRPPSNDECALAGHVVRKHGLALLARAIFNSNEFLYVD